MPPVPENPDAAVDRWLLRLGAYEAFDDAWWEAVAALHELGYDIVPRLIDAVADEQYSVHKGVARALSRFGSAILYDTIGALTHPDVKVRDWAANALYYKAVGEINARRGTGDRQCPAIADAIPALIATLRDPEEQVRQMAVIAINMMGHARLIRGAEAEEAVSALAELLEDECCSVREWTANALGTIGFAAKPAVGGLTRLLLDDVPGVREAASEALNSIQRSWEPPLS